MKDKNYVSKSICTDFSWAQFSFSGDKNVSFLL